MAHPTSPQIPTSRLGASEDPHWGTGTVSKYSRFIPSSEKAEAVSRVESGPS